MSVLSVFGADVPPARRAWQASPLMASLFALLCGAGLLEAAELPSAVVRDFRKYSDPITARPPLPHPPGSAGSPCARFEAITNAQLVGYRQPVRGHYEPPSTCPPPWGQVVLELAGSVKGVQFDRYGAVWFRDVELLRLTTPEPSPAGIRWSVEKDVSDYASVFSEPGDVTIQIPNIVDNTYTGILIVNVSLSFYKGDWAMPSYQVVPLVKDFNTVANPLGLITVSGPGGQVNMVSLPRNAVSAYLNVYASGHQCEEFWYVNPLGTTGCGGGAFRELRVIVDGHLVGAQYPFPVLYTGGLNPLLWRPLTGILSFDIPAYSFDLTPVLPWLTDGEMHNITLHVLGNVPKGWWLLNGVLVFEQGEDEVIGGEVEVIQTPAPCVNETTGPGGPGVTVQHMSAQTQYHIRGSMQLRSGERSESEVLGNLRAWSTNTFHDSEQNVVGNWHSETVFVRGGKRRAVIASYPFEATVKDDENSTGFQLDAKVDHSRNIDFVFDEASPSRAQKASDTFSSDAVKIELRNRLASHAKYNRSTTTPRRVNVEAGNATNHFTISFGPARPPDNATPPCYERHVTADDGAITSDNMYDGCVWEQGPYIGGQELCRAFNFTSVPQLGVSAAKRGAPAGLRQAVATASDPPAPLLGRLPDCESLRGPRGVVPVKISALWETIPEGDTPLERFV